MSISKSLAFLTLFIYSPLHADEDSMCPEILKFASAATKNKPISVSLTTNWGNFSKSCAHHQLKSEKDFCRWLIQNTSMEFMHINLSRVVACLSDQKQNIFNSALHFSSSTGEFSVYEIKGISSDITLTVKYSFGLDKGDPELKISATKEP